MIDRTANMRAIVTGRGNIAGFTEGARKCHKLQAHRRMRLAGKKEIRQQEIEMQRAAEGQQWEDSFYFGPYMSFVERDYVEEIDPQEEARQKRLSARRARYKQKKIARQVEQYKALYAELKKLDKKLEPQSRYELSVAGLLLYVS